LDDWHKASDVASEKLARKKIEIKTLEESLDSLDKAYLEMVKRQKEGEKELNDHLAGSAKLVKVIEEQDKELQMLKDRLETETNSGLFETREKVYSDNILKRLAKIIPTETGILRHLKTKDIINIMLLKVDQYESWAQLDHTKFGLVVETIVNNYFLKVITETRLFDSKTFAQHIHKDKANDVSEM
jgi:hypothetical protein